MEVQWINNRAAPPDGCFVIWQHPPGACQSPAQCTAGHQAVSKGHKNLVWAGWLSRKRVLICLYSYSHIKRMSINMSLICWNVAVFLNHPAQFYFKILYTITTTIRGGGREEEPSTEYNARLCFKYILLVCKGYIKIQDIILPFKMWLDSDASQQKYWDSFFYAKQIKLYQILY